ncbi:MAG: methyltransferase domain-containing protein [Rhodospirillales bacterium]|nr:methyltransferase domain-containing protein [Rhodospirillales bacterium]
MNWNPEQYLKFADHRLRPGLDLMAQIAASQPKKIYDLGCGTGNLTRILAERWPGAQVTGVDSSPQMLERARAEPSDIEWVEADIASWSPAAPADVIFSNAALHWLDDHQVLFLKLLTKLAPDGVLAVQMPKNHDAKSHTLIAEGVRAGPWAALLTPLLREVPVGTTEFYYDLLAPHASALDIWESEYTQILAGENPVLEWVRATALKPLLDALEGSVNADWKAAFLGDYTQRLNKAYPPRSDGRTLFPFRRLFLIAVN